MTDPVDLSNPSKIWKTKLRSMIEEPDWEFQFEHCQRRGIIGIGWRIDELPAGTNLDSVCEFLEARDEPGWGRNAALTVRRLGETAKIGDFVWTRDLDGRYWVCRITGPYRYENDEDARRADVHQIRPVDWAPAPLNDLAVPGAVIRNFSGPALSFSQIDNETARVLTAYWWEVLHNRPAPELAMDHREVITSALDPYDVEDLVYLWLQSERNYMVLPRSRQRDMPAYEWTMIERSTGSRAITQVKTGGQTLDLDALRRARADDTMETYAFATCETYDGDDGGSTVIISVDELVEFANANRELLSGRIRAMFELAD